MAKNIVAIYAGRFHPFHKGHKAVYDSLVSKFGADRVFVATSGKQNDTDSPFAFKEKAAMMMLTGVPAKAISQEVSPYKPDNALKKFPTDTAVVFAVGQKDMEENPRFKPGLKKDGTPTYYQPLGKNKVEDLDGYEKHGYLIVAPTVKFTVLGVPATSASELRARYGKLDDEQRGEFIKDLFGSFDDVIKKVMDKRLAENIIEFVKQSDALKVLHNIENRKSPFKVRYKDGTVTVSPVQARTFLNRYYQAGEELKKEMERKLSIFDYAKKWFRRDAKGYSPVTEDFSVKTRQVFSGNEGILVKQIKRLLKVVKDIEALDKEQAIDKEIMVHILSQLRKITNHINDMKMKESIMKYVETKESLYQLDRDDYLDSEVLIQGLGRMTLRQAIKRVQDYGEEIARVAGTQDPFSIKSKLHHHVDILKHYKDAVLDAYKDLGAIRKKGGVKSKGIPADVGETTMKIQDIVITENFDVVEGKAITEEQFDKLAEKQDACYHKVKSRYKVWPSAYASGALVQCRKVGAKNWGNKSKK
jgi:hypothetical protein